MSLRRHTARDANELEIVRALTQAGASVVRLNEPGAPDLLVGYHGSTYLLEVKLPLGARGGTKDRQLTQRQVRWWREWHGHPPVVVRHPHEALATLGLFPDPDDEPHTPPRHAA